MILDIIVHKTDDGCTAEVPTLKGCETWAHDEETVLKNVMELAAYYLKTEIKEFKIDKARGSRTKIIYKLVFNKSLP
jgi:predicted RNase H-like HicB family nuclease